MTKSTPPPRAKPLKRPSQARAKFTVQAIYDAFVRIWQRDGWAGITTRAVALETGISVGTFYEYFPNKAALLSGYVRHCLDELLAAIDDELVRGAAVDSAQCVRRLVRLTLGMDTANAPFFDTDMLQLETQIAEPKHHRRVYEELSAKWCAALARCITPPPSPETVKALLLLVFGGRRYRLLVQPQDIDAATWVAEVEVFCARALRITK